MAGPAERRGFWGVAAAGDSRLLRERGPADPVELFGTASAVTVRCHSGRRRDADERTIPVRPGDAGRHTCGVRMRGDRARKGNRTTAQAVPESSFSVKSVGHESGSALPRQSAFLMISKPFKNPSISGFSSLNSFCVVQVTS